LTVHAAMQALEKMGCSFQLDESGGVRFRFDAERPPEASALLEIARTDRVAAADYVRHQGSGAVVVDDGCTYSVLDALAIAQAVRRGDAILLGPVIFHREPVNVTVLWQPVHDTAEAVLERHRERLEKALRRRLQAMEQQTLEGWTDAETDAFCEKYSQYKMLLGGCDEKD